MIAGWLLEQADSFIEFVLRGVSGFSFHIGNHPAVLAILHYMYTLNFILPITTAFLPIIGLYIAYMGFWVVCKIVQFVINVIGFNGARIG